MITDLRKTPWPFFGGKADAADAVWAAIGDVPHYVESFAGSLAVLLRRPHVANRTYYSETVNDVDGLICNAWRAIQWHPDATAEAASWPVCEADMHARHLAILKWRRERDLERLMGDPMWCDPVIAGWWIWGTCCWIGSGWCSGRGPWIVGADGRITRRSGKEDGVKRQLPHLGNDGMGVNRPQLREQGVWRQLPHISDNGRGINHAGLREEGVGDFHPMTMPELRRWFEFLSARLRHVRILNGDWKRSVTTGAAQTLSVRKGDGPAGIFLDPPYAATAGRDMDLYTYDCGEVAHEAREWAISVGADPKWRIVFAGFAGEHGDAFARAGWRDVTWFTDGYLKGGMAQQSEKGHQQDRERLWLSPHCLGRTENPKQGSLF